MTKLIDKVAIDLVARGWNNLHKVTLVFPMQRAGLYLKEALKRELLLSGYSKPVRMPEIVTIDELADHLSPYHGEEEILGVCRLFRIYSKHTANLYTAGRPRMTLDVFYNWGRQLMTDFSNVDMALLNPKEIFSNTAAAHQFESVDMDEELRERLLQLIGRQDWKQSEESIRFHMEQLWSTLPAIREEFYEEMEHQNIGLRGTRFRYVVEHMEELHEKIVGRTYIFVGFNYLLAAERQLMLELQSRDQALFYWDERKTFATNPDVYKFIKENISKYNLINALPEEEDSAPRVVTAVAAASSAAQAQFVHRWLQQHHREGDKTAIIIADESMLEQVIYALPDTLQNQVYHANITKGFPLRNTRIYAEVMNFLLAQPTAGESLTDWLKRLLDKVLSPSEDAERHSSDENLTTWQHALVQESLYQTRRIISRMIQLLEQELKDDVVEAKALTNLLRRMLETVSLPFHGEPVTDIQVMGVLETRLLDFDHLLILNVEEGVLPAAAKDNSFIPFYLRKYYHMQTADEEALIYAYNFFRLMRRCDDVTLLFNDSSVGTDKRSMSRFLMQMLVTPAEFKVTKERLLERSQTSKPDAELCVETQSAFTKPKISPSAINTYIQCPLRFYLSSVRDIRQPEEKSLILNVAQLGNLVHGTLHLIYRHLCGGKDNCLSEPVTITTTMLDTYLNDDVALEKMLDAAYAEQNNEYRSHHKGVTEDFFKKEEHPVENRVIREHVRKMLRRDRKTALSGLEIVLLEQDCYVDYPIEGHTIAVGGKIDRLDIVSVNGVRTLRILDYKTGVFNSSKLEVTQLRYLLEDYGHHELNQTMIYCLVIALGGKVGDLPVLATLQESYAGMLPIMPQLLFTQLEDGDACLKVGLPMMVPDNKGEQKLKFVKTPVINFCANFQQEYQEGFTNLLREILERQFLHSEELRCAEQKCSAYCPFHVLCGREVKTFGR